MRETKRARDEEREANFKDALNKKRISKFWGHKLWRKWNREAQEEQPTSSSTQPRGIEGAAPENDKVSHIQ